MHSQISSFFFFNDTATTEIYTLSLHDALPIYAGRLARAGAHRPAPAHHAQLRDQHGDRKSTRLNSSHLVISYAVFCLKKKIISLQHTLTHINPTHTTPRVPMRTAYRRHLSSAS